MFSLSYILCGAGWATATVECDGASIEIQASYLSDALGDLARAARGIMRGLQEVSFSFQQEPGEHRFLVTREGDGVRVRVCRFPDTFSRLQNGQEVFSTACSLGEFANACINSLRRVLDVNGASGYLQRWKNARFPLQEYHDLLQLRRELSRPQRPETRLPSASSSGCGRRYGISTTACVGSSIA